MGPALGRCLPWQGTANLFVVLNWASSQHGSQSAYMMSKGLKSKYSSAQGRSCITFQDLNSESTLFANESQTCPY